MNPPSWPPPVGAGLAVWGVVGLLLAFSLLLAVIFYLTRGDD